MRKTIIFLLITVGFNLSIFSQPLNIEYTSSADSLLMYELLGNNCVTIHNVSYTGDNISFGHFTRTTVNFPLDEGLILSTGNAQDAAGPNDSGSTTTNTTGGNDSLLSLLTSYDVNDVAYLEYSFTNHTNFYTLDFIFGSDEYLEWVNSSFHDLVGIFVTGPGPNGTYWTDKNIALVPGTQDIINIGNINNFYNSGYYFNNGTGGTPNNEAIQYDGYTVTMQASFNTHGDGEYTVKIIIGDSGDSAYDSGIFFRSDPTIAPDLDYRIEIASAYGNGLQLFEGIPADLLFIRNDLSTINSNIHILFNLSGDAIMGLDYSPLPLSLYIPPGLTQSIIPLQIYDDTLTESSESIIFTDYLECFQNDLNFSPQIYDEYFFDAGIENDTIFSCTDSTTITTFANSIDSLVSYMWSTGENTNSMTYYNTANYTETFYITITHSDGFQIIDQVLVIHSETMTLNLTEIPDSCSFGSVDLEVSGGMQPYSFLWNNGESTEDLFNIAPDYYSVTVSDNISCEQIISINVLSEPPLQNTFQVNANCNYNVGDIICNPEFGNPPYSYLWGNSYTYSELINVQPGDYYITITDSYGCELTDSLINFFPQVFSVNLNYTTIGCMPGTAEIIINSGNPPYNISWSSGQTDTSLIEFTQPGYYSVQVMDNFNCGFSQTFSIDIDSSLIIQIADSIHISPCDSTTGEIIINNIIGQSPFSLNWSTGDTTTQISNLLPGQYILTVTDITGCSTAWEYSIPSMDSFQAELIVSDITDCINMNNGSAEIFCYGGTTPYIYLWSTGDTITAIDGLTDSTYYITVMDACGVEIINYFTPEYEFPLNYSPTIYYPHCNDSTGAIEIPVTSDTNINSWIIDAQSNLINQTYPGQFTFLYPGNYMVYIQDEFGCVDNFSVYLIPDLPEIIAEDTSYLLSCGGELITLNAEMNNISTSIYYTMHNLPFAVEDKSGTSIFTDGPPVDDKYYGPFPIGFEFEFFGISYSEFYVGTNGWISFSPLSENTYDPWQSLPIPNPLSNYPRNSIMGVYRDWHPGVSGTIKYNTIGNYPNRKLVVTYDSLALFSCTSLKGDFQIVLFEESNFIDVNMVDVPVCPTWNSGLGTSGIQNAAGTVAFALPEYNGTMFTANNSKIRYQPTETQWYDPNGDLIGNGNQITIPVFETGTYSCHFETCAGLFTDNISIYVETYLPVSKFSFERYTDIFIFTNESQYSIDYLWDFGDGSASTSTEHTDHMFPNLSSTEIYTVSLIALNQCGSDTSQMIIKIFGIESINSQFEVYPNPTKDIIIIKNKNNKKYNIVLRNILGQLLFSKQNLESTNEIDLGSFPDGIYLLEIKFKDRSLTYKVVKE